MNTTPDMILAVWNKGTPAGNNDPRIWRKDCCGAWIRFDQYGKRESQYGWEIDHIVCQSKGGSDRIANLRPLQWDNNASRGDGDLVCKVTAQGTKNVSIAPSVGVLKR